MISQEEIFDFFQKMSIEMSNNGYPILDNIIHPFPGIKWKEEILKENLKNNNFESDSELTDSDSNS